MRELRISIEINGKSVDVGRIVGNNIENAVFTYDMEYIEKGCPAISISLPVTSNTFTPMQTKNFFEGLLPEGFTRRTVAGWLHVDENDYLSIIAKLGCECLGAIRIVEGDEKPNTKAYYNKLSLSQVKALAQEGATKSAEIVTESHLSLTGASGKVGLMYDGKNWFQPVFDAPSTHIVKQSHVRYDSIVLNEQLSLTTAKELGLDIAESMIINVGDGKDEDVLFASKRYDRMITEQCEFIGELKRPFRLHQEDFAQAMGIPTADKYEKNDGDYFVQMFDVIRKYSANPLEDGMKLWKMTVFDFLIGNTDNHIKNHSLLYSPELTSIRLAPVYDVVSTGIYQNSTRNMAFKIGSKYSLDEINRKSFSEAADKCGIGERMALKVLDEMASNFEKALDIATENLTRQDFSQAENIKSRILASCGYSRIK